MRLKYRVDGKVIGYQKIGSNVEIPQIKQVINYKGKGYEVLAVKVRTAELYEVSLTTKNISLMSRIFRRGR